MDGRDYLIAPEEVERFRREKRPAHRPRKEATMQKELIMVDLDSFGLGEVRTLNIYERDGRWVAHWEDDESHYGATKEEARAGAMDEAHQRWPGFRGPWGTIEELRAATMPDSARWVEARRKGLI